MHNSECDIIMIQPEYKRPLYFKHTYAKNRD